MYFPNLYFCIPDSTTIVVASPTSTTPPLVRALELPMSGLVSEANGIHQSDVIIRTALVAAMADLRANPWLLDYVFASLPKDELTLKDYGERSVDKAKDWFLKTEIPVSMVPRLDEGRWPRITISLADSQETENTLGDVHYEPVQYQNDNRVLSEAFSCEAYNPQTGQITLPTALVADLRVGPGMYITDKIGTEHLILSQDTDAIIFIAPNTIADFTNSTIKGVKPTTAVHLESAAFKETYHIGLHVGSEPVYLTWLHSIISFALLRYREALLEARGFERSFFTSSDFTKNEQFEGELVFSRFITINGVVRNYWPKFTGPTINNTLPALRVFPANTLPTSDDDVKKENALWVGQNDILDSDGIG